LRDPPCFEKKGGDFRSFKKGGRKVGLYKVVFLGMTVAGQEEEARLIGGLQKKFNLSPEKAERLLQKVPVVVKKGLSKEEMERYVKAFEEIGGRVKVEEEMTVEPEIGLAPDLEREPYGGKEPDREREPHQEREVVQEKEPYRESGAYQEGMITCPQCGFVQPKTEECIKCGIIFSKYRQYEEMARSFEGKFREISSEESSPWEGKEGFVGAFFQTTQEVLFSPTKFFKKVAAGKGYWSPFIFAMISGIIGFGVVLLWQWLFFSRMVPPRIHSMIPYSLFLGVVVISIPFVIAFSILIGSAVTHLCLMIVGGNRKGFEATFRAISYSYSAQLFYVVPFIGNFVGGIYIFILTIIGMREGHHISTGRAALAVLLPLIVAAGLGILMAILLPIYIGSLGLSRGVGV
jgi:hypothetical protein